VPQFVIAGGGIGGLSAALSIARHGHHVHVVERKPSFVELGAGIQLAPNAFHALDCIGVGEQVRASAVPVDDLSVMDGLSGQVLAQLPLDEEYRERFGDSYAVVERADLYAPLLAACRENPLITLSAGAGLVEYSQTPESVRCRLSSGQHVDADALVGADGIWSTVRQQLLGDGPPDVSGHTIYRTVLPMASVPEELRASSVRLWAGPGWHVVHYPIAGGTKMNLAAVRDDNATAVVSACRGACGANHRALSVSDEHVRSAFPGLCRAPRRLLELGTGWKTWVLCDRAPVTRWASGRVVLLGDAAHPMLQYAAQGAAMAIEDAVVLGTLLRASTEIAGALARFTALRRDRTARTQVVSRWMGQAIDHPSGAEAESRTALLASLSTHDLLEEVAWLHGFRVGHDTNPLTRKGTMAHGDSPR
jgi:2-polyprenyl-6-methoxyphenol hydroxylase-like FAD-dependent oxidoreductase